MLIKLLIKIIITLILLFNNTLFYNTIFYILYKIAYQSNLNIRTNVEHILFIILTFLEPL